MKILGIDFYNGSAQEVVYLLRSGGLLVVPSAPGLATIKEDPVYYQSLLTADIVIPDSSYMTIIWNLTHKEKLKRISGLQFLIAFLQDHAVRKTSDIFLINPSEKETEANLQYLNKIGLNAGNDLSYLAPMYDKLSVKDQELVDILEKRKPQYIIINIGGGIQEKLGAYLRKNISYKPAIICTGAAIAFLSGQQARIPSWADKFHVAWLFRCFKNPGLFVPRYIKAFKLVILMLKYGKKVTPTTD